MHTVTRSQAKLTLHRLIGESANTHHQRTEQCSINL